MRKIIYFFGITLLTYVLFSEKERLPEPIKEALETVESGFVEGFEMIKETIIETKEIMSEGFDYLYKKWANILGIDWKIIKSISLVESSENPAAIGDGGRSFGLMQVQNVIGRYYADSENEGLLDPEKNIEAGSKFLAEMILKYGIDGGIQAYNLGETKYIEGKKSYTYLAKVKQTFDYLNSLA